MDGGLIILVTIFGKFILGLLAVLFPISLIVSLCSALPYRLTRREENYGLTAVLFVTVTAVIAASLRITQSDIIMGPDADQYWQFWVFCYFAVIAAGSALLGAGYIAIRIVDRLWTGMIDAIRGERSS